MRLIRSPGAPGKGLSFLFVNFTGRMTMSARYVAILFILFGVVALFLAITVASHDPREQTVLLERFAEQLAQAQNIPPATEQSTKALIASFRQNPPADTKLQQRQIAAINRIEATLSDQTGALRQNNIARSRYNRTHSPSQISGEMSDK